MEPSKRIEEIHSVKLQEGRRGLNVSYKGGSIELVCLSEREATTWLRLFNEAFFPVPSPREFTFLSKELGVQFQDKENKICVSNVEPYGVASMLGVRTGFELLGINGTKLNSATAESVSKVIGISKVPMRLAFAYDDFKTVTFQKKKQLGMKFEVLDKQVIISYVDPDQHAAQFGLAVGDVVVSLNNECFVTPSSPYTFETLLAAQKWPVIMMVKKAWGLDSLAAAGYEVSTHSSPKLSNSPGSKEEDGKENADLAANLVTVPEKPTQQLYLQQEEKEKEKQEEQEKEQEQPQQQEPQQLESQQPESDLQPEVQPSTTEGAPVTNDTDTVETPAATLSIDESTTRTIVTPNPPQIVEGDDEQPAYCRFSYAIKFKSTPEPHTIAYRFSDFTLLRNCLIRLHPFIESIPFPSKTFLHSSSILPDIVAQREEMLNVWLDTLLNLPELADSNDIKYFVGVQSI
jgi:hypothetical protein